MRILNTINQLIKNENFNELENFLSSIENLPSDNDGNPLSIGLLKNKQFKAIQSIHKIIPFDSSDLFFALRFVSSNELNDCVNFILDEKLLNLNSLVLGENISIIANENLFQLITNYHKHKNEKIFDDNFLKLFFLKKDFNFNQPIILNFISNNIKDESLFLFIYFLIEKCDIKFSNDLLTFNLLRIKNDIENFSSFPKFKKFLEVITEKIIEKNKGKDSEYLLLLEQIKNISLYFKLINEDKKEIKTNNKNKI